MILQVSPSWRLIGRAPNHCSPDAPGQEIHRNPAPAPDTEPCESEGSRPRCRVGRQMRLRDARARGKNEPGNDDSHHDQRGRRSVRGDAPHAPPQPYRDPTLLQHQWLHQLPHRRSDDRGGNLPDLRIHAADALDRIRPDWRGERRRVCSHSVPSDRRLPCFQPIFAPRAHATCRDRRWPQDARLARPHVQDSTENLQHVAESERIGWPTHGTRRTCTPGVNLCWLAAPSWP